MKKLKILCYLFSITVIVLLLVCSTTGCKKEVIICSFEFLNAETGEYVKPFEKIYLTYDGDQKNIDFKTVRDDSGKEVNFIEDINISYTYKNPKMGELEYGLSCMQEIGEYYLCINSCSYDEDKYYIASYVTLTIYIQEEGAAKSIEMNTMYPVSISNNDTLKFEFTAPYSMQYSISVEKAKVKVSGFISEVELAEENENIFFINKNQKVIIELCSINEAIDEMFLITPSPELLRIGKVSEYRLGYGGQCVYKFVDDRNHNLKISTNNSDVGAVIYNDKENTLYYSLSDDDYFYTADQEVYIL